MARKQNPTAYHLIDEEVRGYGHHEESPWDTDHRGNGAYYSRVDTVRPVKSTNTKFPTFRRRNINEEVTGVLTFEGTYQIVSGDGFYFGFWGNKGNETEAFVLKQNGDKLYAGSTPVLKADNNWHYIKMVIDIDKGEVAIHLDGKFICRTAFTGKATTICRFQYGYDIESLGEAHFHMVMKLYKNYLFNDYSPSPFACVIPEEYIIEKSGKSTLTRRQYREGSKFIVYELKGQTGSKTQISRSFDRACGVVGYEMKYLLPKAGGKLTVCLTSSGDEVISICDELCAICSQDGVLRTHQKNVWQTLRIEADTSTSTALIRLNGKVVTTISLDNKCDYIDGIKLSFECDKAATLMFTDLKAFPIPPLPADYVPEPVLPKKKGDYYIGMNICSLWREGSHYGWDCISAFKEHKPLLGYYDEGIPEAADWELKWMAEHGLDFQLYCWYASENKLPMLKTWLSSEIVDGHMMAKYSDKVKMALLWEATGNCPETFDDFKNFFVPYWIDYYFSDPRYMQIDGYAVMSIYRPERVINNFGSTAACKKAFDYLRKEVKKLGYKGLIIMCCGYNSPTYKQVGIDGCHCYNWGKKGYDVETTKELLLENIKEGSVHPVPCVSMGYNDLPWAGKRYPVLKPEDMVTLLEWCKTEMLDKQDKNSWKSKLVILSTWNEYGEGTYMMPAGVYGFGYLDALRKVFYEDTPHADIVPNRDQLDRVCILYPEGREMIAPHHLYDEEKKKDTSKFPLLKRYEFKTKKDLEKWEINNIPEFSIKDGKLCGHCTGGDPQMILHDDEFFPISTEKVGMISVYIRGAKPNKTKCAIQQSFLKKDKGWTSQWNFNTNPDEVERGDFMPSEINDFWHDILEGYRLDPLWSSGDFELEAVEFYQAPPHKLLHINNQIIDTCDMPYEEDGIMYLPFDTKSKLKHLENMYYEWDAENQKLTIFAEKTVILTKNSDKVIMDGVESKLARPLKFYDGIPHLPLDLFCEALNMTLEIKGDDIKISYK